MMMIHQTYAQLQKLSIIICTIFSCALQWEWLWSFTLPFALYLKSAGALSFWFKGLKHCFKVFLPQWSITINYIFFGMALREDKFQLLIVSYVLASGHDLVTVWLSPEACHQWQLHCQGSLLWPDQPAGAAHCSRLLMTSWAPGKDMGIVTSVWVYKNDTKQHWCQLRLGPWLETS